MAANVARMNPQRSPFFRSTLETLERASNPELLSSTIQTAHQARFAGRLTAKAFEALKTLYETKTALLENRLVSNERQNDHLFTVSTPLLNEARTILTKDLRNL